MAEGGWRAALAVGVLGAVGLATFPPAGLEGDGLRALVVLLGGALAALLALAAWGRPAAEDAGPAAGPPEVPRRPGPARAPTLAAGVVVAAAALQLVPLPAGVVAALAPATAALHAEDAAAAALGAARGAPAPPGARPLSLEPVATARAAALALAYLAVLLAAARAGEDERAAARLALGLALLAGVTGLAALFGASEAGAGDPWRGRPTWPLRNPNHLATYLTLGLGLALGVLLGPLPALASSRLDSALARRGLAGLAAALCVLGIVLSQSRAGLAAAATAAVVTVGLAGRMRSRGRYAVAAVGLALALGVALSDPDPLRARIGDTSRVDGLGGRLESWRCALAVVAERPLAGAGLATYDDASTVTRALAAGGSRPGDAHMDYLELAAGIGLPAAAGAALLVLGLVLVLARRARRLDDPRHRALAAGALGAAAGALAHAVFDFALQIPGPATLCAAALGLALALAGGPRRGRASPGPALCAAALALGLLLAGGPLLASARREAAAIAALERAARADPGDGLGPELARRAARLLEAADGPLGSAELAMARAQAALLAGDEDAAAQAEASARAAVGRAPGRARAHTLLGVVLTSAGAEADAEAGARLALAARLAPGWPSVTLARAALEVERLARTGRPAHAAAAEGLLREAAADPTARRRARAIVERYGPRLGASLDPLRAAAAGGPPPPGP